VGDCKHNEQNKWDQDGQCAGNQAVAHDGEAPVVHVGQQQGHAHQEDTAQICGLRYSERHHNAEPCVTELAKT